MSHSSAVRSAEHRSTGLEIRHAWLQKHPTPVAAAGEFHWFPREGDRDLRAELVERMRGLDPPAVLWELSPGRVVWARAFAAHAPTDGRRYVGLAVTIAEAGGVAAADLLAAIDPADAVPWTEQTAISDAIAATSRAAARFGAARTFDRLEAIAVDATDPAFARPVPREDSIAIARTLISGGIARIAPHDRLTSVVAALEAQMPPAIARQRRQGACVIEDRAADNAGGLRAAPSDPVSDLAVAAWQEPASTRATAWRFLAELGAIRGEPLDEVWLANATPALGVLGDEERSALRSRTTSRAPGTPVAITDVLHAWGRGWFDLCPTAGSIVTRLADAVALQVLVELADGRDGQAAIAAARWHAVLPAARRVRLFETLIERAATLRVLVGGI